MDLYTFLMPFTGKTRVYICDNYNGYLLIDGKLEDLNYEMYDFCPVTKTEISNGNLIVYIERS